LVGANWSLLGEGEEGVEKRRLNKRATRHSVRLRCRTIKELRNADAVRNILLPLYLAHMRG